MSPEPSPDPGAVPARDLLLLTGASSDLGVALMRRLAAAPDGPIVVAHHWSGADRIQALREELGADRVLPVRADLGTAAGVEAFAAEVEATHGVPSQVVHLPGLKLVYERFTKLDLAHLHRDLELQIDAPILLLRRFLPKMVKAKLPRARVVFVLSSVTRGLPPKFLSMYTVVKYAQLGLMKALASEYVGTNVTVNAVAPSMVATQFLSRLPELAVQQVAAGSPRGRHATPEEVVGAIAFLLSPEAGYVSGAEIPITAGGV